MKEIHQIYDKAFKRILTLSDKAVINLINGLFGTDYPTNSKITYNWTEHEDRELKRTLSASILTINGRDIYHMEELQNLIMNDIITTIHRNEEVAEMRDENLYLRNENSSLKDIIINLQKELKSIQEK